MAKVQVYIGRSETPYRFIQDEKRSIHRYDTAVLLHCAESCPKFTGKDKESGTLQGISNAYFAVVAKGK